MKSVSVALGKMVLYLCTAMILCTRATGTEPASVKTIHLFVALADNKNQGIVPVPEKLGNGEDAKNNLYWGALYGVKTRFRRSRDWELLLSMKNPVSGVLERCIFKYKDGDVYLVADAYRGSKIKKAIMDFLQSSAGQQGNRLNYRNMEIRIYGDADFAGYVGHNGLMDFSIDRTKIKCKKAGVDVMVLACLSKPYFRKRLLESGANPVLLTTGLMAPEAYTIEAVLSGWIHDLPGHEIRNLAAAAYHKYQHCGLKNAKKLFYVPVRNP